MFGGYQLHPKTFIVTHYTHYLLNPLKLTLHTKATKLAALEDCLEEASVQVKRKFAQSGVGIFLGMWHVPNKNRLLGYCYHEEWASIPAVLTSLSPCLVQRDYICKVGQEENHGPHADSKVYSCGILPALTSSMGALSMLPVPEKSAPGDQLSAGQRQV